MTVSLHNITVDCADARALGAFWSALTGWPLFYDDDPEVLVAPSYPPTTFPTMLFIPVPEGKTAKNRMHLDLQPTDCTRDEQVERAVALGATILGDHRKDDGTGWVTLTDPEGNEFCIERSAAEHAAASSASSSPVPRSIGLIT
jgi:predicted enzyme related to lactoylglutathione lyase